MEKVVIEFINTWPSCDAHVDSINAIAARYGDAVEVKIYYAGKDIEYIRKYGMVTRGTMIVNGKKKIDGLSRAAIEKAIDDALRSMGFGCGGT